MRGVARWAASGFVLACLLTLAGSAGAAQSWLDPTFGSGGTVTATMPVASKIFALARQPDGKIVAVGSGAVARYTADGALDPAFGSGGVTTMPAGGEWWAVALEGDGKVVVAGRFNNGASVDFGVSRLNQDGSFDTSFGSGGLVLTDMGGSTDWARAVVIQPDGKIVVGGRGMGYPAGDFALARYNPDGSLDSSFGSGGKVTTDFAGSRDAIASLVRQPDGKLVASGTGRLARYNVDGGLDATFGTGGQAATPFGGSTIENPLALLPDGKIVMVGWRPGVAPALKDVVRFTADGAVDPSFADGGNTMFPGFVEFWAIAAQPDGKIALAGWQINPREGDFSDVVVARLTSDGSADTSFGDGGLATADTFSGTNGEESANAVLVLPEGKLLAGGYTASGSGFSFLLARFLGHPPGPANDAFTAPVALAGLTSPIDATNEFASKEAGEPLHGSDAGGASVWFTWAPSFTGTAFVSTAGSDFDTLVGVYTGTAVSALTAVASNDDATVSENTSRACFPVSAGVTYRIAVDGWGAAAGFDDSEGAVELSWGQYTGTDPCAVLPAVLSGSARVGGTLTTSNGTWVGSVAGYDYQWYACHLDEAECFTVSGATSSSFTLPARWEGYAVQAAVIARHPTDPALNAVSYTMPSAPIAAASGGGSSGGGSSGGGGGGGSNDLVVSGTVDRTTAPVGGSHVWRIDVANVGGGIAFGVNVDVKISPNIVYGFSQVNRGSGCTATATAGTYRCNLDILGPKGSGTDVGEIVFGTNVVATGEVTLTASAGFRDADPTPANDIVTLKSNTPAAPLTPPTATTVKPVIGKAVATPLLPLAGTRFTFVVPVARSTDGKPMTGGTMACSPLVAGKLLRHVDSFRAGKARLSLVVPKTAKGKLLTVKLKIVSIAGQAGSRTFTYRIR